MYSLCNVFIRVSAIYYVYYTHSHTYTHTSKRTYPCTYMRIHVKISITHRYFIINKPYT